MLSPEEIVQAGIVDMLRTSYDVETHFTGNTRIGSIAARRIRKVLGSRRGWKDLVVLAPGPVTVWLEVKAPKDPYLGTKKKTPLSADQKELLPKLQEWGHNIHVVYSKAEAAEVLAGHGIHPKPGITLYLN